MTVELITAGNLNVLLKVITAKQLVALCKIDQIGAIASFKKSCIYRVMRSPLRCLSAGARAGI